MSGATGVKRVKSGCVTCRIRRVKCGEEKPECKRCLSTGRKCDGYSTLPFSRRDLQAASQSAIRQRNPILGADKVEGLLPRLVTDPAFSDLLEKRYFQFFRQCTVASTNSIVDCRFWDRVVLQACHAEPAIKHAVLTLSSLHQLNGLASDSDTAYQHRLYAEKQHHKALAAARGLIASASAENVDRVLIACIIFIIFEGVRGDYRAAAMHMDSGRAIVAQNSHRLKNASRRRDLVEIEQAFARLDLPAMCFADRTSPYPYTLSDFYQTNPVLTHDYFQDVNECQAAFVDLMRWLLVICRHLDKEHRHGSLQSMARYQAEKQKCAAHFKQWHSLFMDIIERADEPTNPMILNLRAWYACAAINIAVETYAPESAYDIFMHHFEDTVVYAEKLAPGIAEPSAKRSFSFDLGYSIPVYFAATRCRDPRLRRRAIALLQAYPRQEGVWESVAASMIAKRWMEVEEEGLGPVESASDIPEHRRIRYISTEVDVDCGTASVKLATAEKAEEPTEVFANWEAAARPNAGAFSLASDDYLRLFEGEKGLPTFQVRRKYEWCAGVEDVSEDELLDPADLTVKVEIFSH